MVSEVKFLMVSSLNLRVSGRRPSLYCHLAVGCGLPPNGISTAADWPAYSNNLSENLWEPNSGATEEKVISASVLSISGLANKTLDGICSLVVCA